MTDVWRVSASIIFMVWTTKKFRLADCQAVSIWTLCSDWSRTEWFKAGSCVFMSRTGWSCGWMMLSGGSSSPSYCWSSCFCGGRLLTTKGKHADDLIVFLPNPSQLSCSRSSKAASWPHTCALCVGMRSHRLSMTRTMRRLKSSWCLQTSVSHTLLSVCMSWGFSVGRCYCIVSKLCWVN